MPRSAGATSIAVVGYGYWGAKHVRVLGNIPGVEVTVVDPRPDRLAEAAAHHPAARMAAHLDDVLTSVDAVVVATPPTSHATLARRAVEHDRAVLVEKPLTTAVEDAEHLVALAEERGVILMAGHTFEYNPAVWKLKDLVHGDVLGRVLYIDTERLNLGRYQDDVNVLWDLAPHDISIASYILEDVPTATAVWTQSYVGGPRADVAYLRLAFPRTGTHAFVHVSWLSPNKVRRVTVVGERKMAVYDDLSDSDRVRVYDSGVDPGTVNGAAGTQAMPVTYRTGDIVSPYIAFQEPLLLQDQHFVDCLRTGRLPRTPGRRGLEVVRVLAAADTVPAAPALMPANGFGGPPIALPANGHRDRHPVR